MASPTQPTRITIDGRTYQLRPWGYEDGERWVIELMRIAFGSMGSASSLPKLPTKKEGEELTPAERAVLMRAALELASAILAGLSAETFAAFRATCCKYTDLVVRDDDGEESVTQLDAKVHLKGRYAVTVQLVAAHIEREYADFFGELGDLLAKLFQGTPAKAG